MGTGAGYFTLRSTVGVGVPTVDIPTAIFFQFLVTFCRFLRKKFRIFFQEIDNFSSENLVGR